MNWLPETGMYVRCKKPLSDNRFIYLYGQVDSISSASGYIRIKLHDLSRLKYLERIYGSIYETRIENVEHTPARFDAKVVYFDTRARIVPAASNSLDSKSFYMYYIEHYQAGESVTEYVSEKDLSIHMTSGALSPVDLMKEKAFYDSSWYTGRTLISEAQAAIRNAPDGFKSILGSRANLFPHQLDTIVRALSERPCRFMLADEVGLGKTIEAGSILMGLMARNRRLRVLIIVPDALRPQWLRELSSKFRIKAITITQSISIDMLKKPGVYIATYDIINQSFAKLTRQELLWDLCIVDEAHKLLHKPNIYKKLLLISRQTENVLVLSATPVLKDGIEYRELLSLIEPERFDSLTETQFKNLVAMQGEIRYSVFNMMRDLPEYVEYDLASEFIERFEEIQEIIHDPALDTLIYKIRQERSPHSSLEYVKTALAYVSEFYRIDNKVIRHRKSEISDALICRELKDVSYDPSGIAEGFYESECLQAAADLFASVLARDPGQIRQCKMLLQATTSSPYAILGLIKGTPPKGDALLDQYFLMVDNWKKAYDWELEHIRELKDNPDGFYSKLSKILRWIDEEDPLEEKKFLIFSEYSKTAVKFFEAFSKYYGENSSKLFVKGMEGRELNQAIDEFQNTAACRFMVCDASGGEGRNFQMADYIVHCDLSWSPAIMEQRIGRLDRIGRNPDKKVVSVVVHSEYGTEMDLFRVYNEGLKVFTKSLCGMEIAFDEVQKTIDNAFVSDSEHGLQYILPEISTYVNQMDAEVEQERYFDQARQLDTYSTQQIERLIDFFTLSNSAPLASAMSRWADAVGITIKEKKAFYDKVDTVVMDLGDLDANKLMSYSYAPPFKPTYDSIFGTFSRDAAVSHEKLYFMAPSNALYDSIARNAVERREGMAACLHLENVGFRWEGFSFCWNIYYDYSRILEKNIPTEYLSILTKFLSAGQIRVFVSMPDLQICENPDVFCAFNNIFSSERSTNVMTIDSNHMELLSKHLLDFDWELCVAEAYLVGSEAAKNRCADILNVQAAEEFLENRYTAIVAKEKDRKSNKVSENISCADYIDLFLSGMKKPVLELDSAAYLIME